jgi:pimeloyl-ACP methyl ester carboxylesterase
MDHEAAYRAAERRLWEASGLPAPAEHRVRLARTGVEVRVQEVGAGPPVLFVHGGPNSGSKWAPLLGHVQGVRCLLVDRPGTGLSDPLPQRFSVPQLLTYADGFVGECLDALGIERADVVASSLGGFLALRSAAAEPHRIGRMVQLGCPAMVPGMRTPPFLRLATLPVVGRLLRRLPATAGANRAAMRQMGHGATLDAGTVPPGYEDWYRALQRHTGTVRGDGSLIASGATWRGFDERLTLTTDLLGRIPTPTRFVWGEDDGFGGAEVARSVVAAMPDAEVELLPRSGHLPWLDHPAAVGAAVAGWLSGVPVSR